MKHQTSNIKRQTLYVEQGGADKNHKPFGKKCLIRTLFQFRKSIIILKSITC
jgi:hypothetical protein